MQVDAFTTQALCGNPCAIVFEADDLSADEMQAIAREQNLSETSFVLRSERADVRARYFTPLTEIPLAGHPTIATIHALVETARLLVPSPHRRIKLELEAGVIDVDIYRQGDAPLRVVMTQLRPQFLAELPAAEVCPVFGVDERELSSGVPIQIVSTGTPQLMVCTKGRDGLRDLHVDYQALAALGEEAGFLSAHLFCVEADGSATFARHFAPEFEDPFTGSATGGMGAFLWRYGLIPEPHFIAKQGDWMQRPGRAQVEVCGPREGISAVKVGGQAVTVINGTLSIP